MDVRLSQLYNGISYTGKKAPLYQNMDVSEFI